eukprot:13282535-Alexandrium_andersonii.AAC.1
MSASLVGSEMCIRDRTRPKLSGAPRSSPELRGALRSSLILDSANSFEAVSYTHLTLPTICSV